MKGWKKALVATVLVLGVVLSIGITATIGWRPFVGPRMRPLTDRTFDATPARVARGAYLMTGVTPCLVCHSEMDPSAFGVPKPGAEGAGQPWFEPELAWLTAPNITPDRETGAGSWSDDAIARAVREGISHDGRTLFPLMPYDKFREMSDEDLASVVAYMRSLRPVRKPLPPSAIPFPVNRLINAAPQPIEGTVPGPDLSTPAQRGKYIVTLAVCADCHTPRNDKNQPIEDMALAGGNMMRIRGQRPVATTNITAASDGIQSYTENVFVEALRTGQVHTRQLSDIMPWRFYRNMTDEDLKAVYAYLKTVKPVEHYVDNSLPATPCPRCGHEHGGGERNRKGS